MAGFALMLLGIAIALWVSVWVLLFFFAIGISAVIWSHMRGFLVAKGILNSRAMVPPDASSHEVDVTIVEGAFTHIEPQAEKISRD